MQARRGSGGLEQPIHVVAGAVAASLDPAMPAIDGLGDLRLRSRRINGADGAGEFQALQQQRNGYDLV